MSVFLGVPSHDGRVDAGTAEAIAAAGKIGIVVYVRHRQSSLLPHVFNQLWCEALNRRAKDCVTHFVMIHADVVPKHHNWLWQMLDEQDIRGADVLSAVIPIKDARGFTSTAWGRDGELIDYVRRVDLGRLPRTFDRSASFRSGDVLLVNTGLFVADITKPWAEKVHFEVQTGIEYRDGEFCPTVLSEDWGLSFQLAALGAKVMATTIVDVEHVGRGVWTNEPTR